MYRLLTAALALAVALWTAPAAAQTQDFNSLARAGLAGNQQLVQQIRTALTQSDLTVLKQQTSAALATAQQVDTLLSQARPLAPDDGSRSRIEGLQQHIRASINALTAALQETTVDATRARLDQARGEAEEALSEFVTFVNTLPLPLPVTLPSTGGLGDVALGVAAALGLILVAAGRALRGTIVPALP
jgi:hypothetical protein